MTRLSSLHAGDGDRLGDPPRTTQLPVEPLDPADALEALQAAPGETATPLELLAAIAHEITQLRAPFSADDVDRGRDAEMRALRGRYASLTPREREVMAGVVSGRLNQQVGGELGISEITVKAHRGQVMRKMKAGSLPELVTMAARLGLAAHAFHF